MLKSPIPFPNPTGSSEPDEDIPRKLERSESDYDQNQNLSSNRNNYTLDIIEEKGPTQLSSLPIKQETFPRNKVVPEDVNPLTLTAEVVSKSETAITRQQSQHQYQYQPLQAPTSVKIQTRYIVKNDDGHTIYFAGENLGFFSRMCLGPSRPYVVYLFDYPDQVTLKVERSCRCCLTIWGGRITGSTIEVKSGSTGELYGTIVQKCSYCKPAHVVLNAAGVKTMEIEGPTCGTFCPCVMMCDSEFLVYLSLSDRSLRLHPPFPFETVMAINGGQDRCHRHRQDRLQFGRVVTSNDGKGNIKGGRVLVGSILSAGVNVISDGDNTYYFGIRFLPNLDPKTKALLIGATWAVDISYLQTPGLACSVCSSVPYVMVCIGLLIFLFIVIMVLKLTQ